jgi:uracil-DNA glycosylase
MNKKNYKPKKITMSKLKSICKICGKVHLNICKHYNKGKYFNIALVFSCPGEDEEEHDMPVYGRTGTRLEKILRELYSKQVFNKRSSRYDFRITNAYSECAPKGKSEWGNKDIKNTNNICRLCEELDDVLTKGKLIVCFGEKAEVAIIELYRKRNDECWATNKCQKGAINKVGKIVSKHIRTAHPSPRTSTSPKKIARNIKTEIAKKKINI